MSTLGYYNPASSQSHTRHQATCDAPAEAPSTTEAGPSSHDKDTELLTTEASPPLAIIGSRPHEPAAHEDEERENTVSLHDEDTRMGPA